MKRPLLPSKRMTVFIHFPPDLPGVQSVDDCSTQRRGKRPCKPPAAAVRRGRQSRDIPSGGDTKLARISGVPKDLQAMPVRPAVPRPFRKQRGVDDDIPLLQAITFAFKHLPDHVPDHLLDPVVYHLLPEPAQQRPLDARHGRLRQLGGGLEANDDGLLVQKPPQLPAEFRLGGWAIPVELIINHPDWTCGGLSDGCAADRDGTPVGHPASITLAPSVFAPRINPGNVTSAATLRLTLNEVGHALGADEEHCNTLNIMCKPILHGIGPLEPTGRDLARIDDWTSIPYSDHQTFGLWAAPAGGGGALTRFGIDVRRTLGNPDPDPWIAADMLDDELQYRAVVDGTPGRGPAPGTGTATWQGLFLGADTAHAEPVTGTATLTADLAALAQLGLVLTELARTGPAGSRTALANATYSLQRGSGDIWTDTGGRADARFYDGAGDSRAALAAGRVSDDGRALVGAWGAAQPTPGG